MDKYFNTEKKVTTTNLIPFTVDQLAELINKEKPELIYHGQWNEQRPFIVITEYNQKGFMLICNGWEDKTPQQFDAEKLYSFLKYQGLSDCFIKAKSEEEAWCDQREAMFNAWERDQKK